MNPADIDFSQDRADWEALSAPERAIATGQRPPVRRDANDSNWAVFENRMNELIPVALAQVEQFFAPYPGEVPFGLSAEDFTAYALDKGTRRLGTISSARGHAVEDIDLDYSPIQLEDTFATEDATSVDALRV